MKKHLKNLSRFVGGGTTVTGSLKIKVRPKDLPIPIPPGPQGFALKQLLKVVPDEIRLTIDL